MLNRQYQSKLLEAGCDEAGRGCLAGPVVAAAVILPADFDISFLDDSKKLKENQRDAAAIIIREKAIAWAIGIVSHEEIDRINILKASIKAMHLAVDQLKKRPKFLIIDGNRFYKYKRIPHLAIVDGDALYASIAAASILAKTHRDELMKKLHLEYPHYGWDHNKGYGTKLHVEKLLEYGISPHHRKTFAPVRDTIQMELEL